MADPATTKTARRLLYALGLGASAVLILAAVEVARQVAFPWDLLVWSESTFMTNMLKLDRGVPLFGPPEDANSFVYSPGLEFLCYALLAPLGLHLDIRACRFVVTVLSLGSAVLVALAAVQLARRLELPRSWGPGFAWLAFALAALLVFDNHTANLTHPDGVLLFHALVTFSLCVAARRRHSYRLALLAMVVAGLGVWAKQNAGLSFVGAGVGLTWGYGWGRKRVAGLLLAGAAVCAASLTYFFIPETNRFYLFSLVSSHWLMWLKVVKLIGFDIGTNAHRVLLWLFGAVALVVVARDRRPALRDFVWPWLGIGVFQVLACLAPYFKIMGIANNLYPIDVWMLLLALPVLAVAAASSAAPSLRALAIVVPIFLVTALFPAHVFSASLLAYSRLEETQTAIRDRHHAYGARLQARVARDLQVGRRVLVAHGTMVLLRAGSREVPRDRMNSVLELKAAGLEHRAGTEERFANRYYDRVYVPAEPLFSVDWYGERAKRALRKHYRITGRIESVNAGHTDAERRFSRALMTDVQVWAPRR